MAIMAQIKTGKNRTVKYGKEYLGDDTIMDDIRATQPKVQDDAVQPPAKKLRTDIGSPASPSEKASTLPESDDNYDISSNKKPKPRKSSSLTSRGKGKGKAKANLQLNTLFDKLPTDVVFVIFSYLHPSDLLRLARINRILRSNLMSKSSVSVWRGAREEVEPPVPGCPPDQSEPQWAQLLFSRDCSCCDRTNIPKVHWFHRLRLCYACNRAGVVLISRPRAQKAFPHIPEVNLLLDLLPHSNSSGKYYRIRDIENVGAEWAAIKKTGNEAEIQEFKDRKRRETAGIMTHGAFCESWDGYRSIHKRTTKFELWQARRNELIERLDALGYNPQDVRAQTVAESGSFTASTPLTEQSWTTIRPKLEALIKRAEAARLQKERNQIVNQRETLAENLIRTYCAASDIAPAFHPHLRDLLNSQSFLATIHQPNEISVTGANFQPALDELPDLFNRTAREIQSDLVHRMISGGAANLDPSSIESNFDRIHLATSTFFCQLDDHILPLCSKDDLSSHCCYAFPEPAIKYHCLAFDHQASSVVAALIAQANLDPNTTADEMDEMDLRFYFSEQPDRSTRMAMSWRDAASEGRLSERIQLGDWGVFSPEDTVAIKKREMANTEDGRSRFRCNTCVHPGWIRRCELGNHLSGWHSITDHPDPTTEFHVHPRLPPHPITFGSAYDNRMWMASLPSEIPGTIARVEPRPRGLPDVSP